MSDLLKAKRYLEKAKELLCLWMTEGSCEKCACSDTDECFINSLESVKNEIELRKRGKSEAQE